MKKRNIQFSSENGQEESIAQKMERNIRAQINKELKEEYDQKKQELEKKYLDQIESLETQYIERKKQLDSELEEEKKRSEEKLSQIKEEKKLEIQKAKEEVSAYKEDKLAEIKQKEEKLSQRIEKANTEIELTNQKIERENYNSAQLVASNERVKKLEELLEVYKSVLKKLTKKEMTLQELYDIVGENQSSKINIGGEIQKNNLYNNGSVFEQTNTGSWYELGYINLGKKTNNDKSNFTENKNLSLLSHYPAKSIYSDGILLEKGEKINIVTARVHSKINDTNIYKFFTDSKIISIYNLLSVANFILHIHQTGLKPTDNKQERGLKLKCLVYSDKKHKNSKNCVFKVNEKNIYNLEYSDDNYINIGILAQELYQNLNCSKKHISPDNIKKADNIAFSRGMQLKDNVEYLKIISPIANNELEQEK